MSEPKKPARISNAPPPIKPLSGGSFQLPPKQQPARWQVWRLMPSVALWQAVCLSLDIEPAEHLKDDATRARSGYSRLPADYWDRLMVCLANLSVTQGPIRVQGPLYRGMKNPNCSVLQSEIAAFAIHCGWTIPPAMRGGLHPEDGAPLGEPEHSPAVPKEAGERRAWIALAKTKAQEIIKRQRAKDLHPSQIAIADEIARAFRTATPQIVGTVGTPLTGAYIKRYALKGISSAQGSQQSTAIGRGKRGKN